MNGNNLLLDTNILIYLSRKELELDKFAKSVDRLSISVITYMEAQGYNFLNKEEENLISDMCDHLHVIYLDKEIVEKVILLRREAKIKLPDAIILATAIVGEMYLVTHNTSDFAFFSDSIHLIDPI